ncbi:hypothetical protein ABZ345_24590 [Lentzea sp. NPDC005914]|uniref:hypothetical protein n=1 Tax=Lentzea sp. NPDC005914 TaxID=3154572 RepID=UPI0033CD538C
MAETAHEIKDSVVEAMAEAGHDRKRLRSVTLTSGDTPSAGSTSYPDGSALIRVSEAVLALIPVYSRHLALSVARPSLFLKRLRWRRRSFDTALLAAVLRFTSRVERSSGRVQTLPIDLEPFQQHTASLIATHGLRFVIAHELAHHLQGPADRLAYQAVLAAQHHDESGEPSLVPLGALVAVAVLHHAEKSLFVRGARHSPVNSRLGVLWEEVPFHDRSSFNSYATGLFEATDLAANFIQGSRPSVDWELLPAAPEHPFARCDELQSLTPAQLVVELHRWPAIGSGARALLDGRIEDAAGLWEVPLDRFHGWQSQTPLAASTLRLGLRTARGLEDLAELERCPVVEAMAALVEHRVIGV